MCDRIENRLGGVSVLSGDVCDVVLVRTSPAIIHEGHTMNKFTLMNSVIEVELPSNISSENRSNIFVMGDFALLETELNPVLKKIAQYDNWKVTGIHNHMIMEEPELLFLHWTATGNIGSVTDQINSIIDLTGIKRNQPSPTPTVNPSPTASPSPTVSPSPTASPSPNSVTVNVMNHLCPANIRTPQDLAGLDKERTCPTILRIGDTPTSGSDSGGNFNFGYVLRARDVNNPSIVRELTQRPVLVRNSDCRDNGCRDMSYYSWNVPKTDVTFTETIPQGGNIVLGFAEIDPADRSALISTGNGIINLNTKNTDGMVMIHVYHFRP
jgi:hypothetical protein